MAAYGTELGIDYEAALKIGNAFGGGIGKTGEMCGAVTGALMVIGLKYGAKDESDNISKGKTYELSDKFMKEFKARNNTVVCRNLIGFDISDPSIPDKTRIIMEKCPAYIKDAAEIIEEILRS